MFDYRKKYASIITRLKLNHGRFPAHLHKLGILQSPSCNCDNVSIGDTNHIFLECKKNKVAISNLYTYLRNNNFPFPLNISSLLACINKDTFDAIINFIKEASIDL